MEVKRVIELNTGGTIPSIGLGAWQMHGAEAIVAISKAIEVGYRHIDTAKVYGNEREVGTALKNCGVPREEIFVTTKLWNEDQGYDTTLRAIEESLERLDMEYVDLYLVHWPYVSWREGESRRKETWKAMEEIYESGLAAAIGVSNFEIEHLEEMKEFSKITPAANQIEQHPFLYQPELNEYCADNGIVVENYSPLTRGKMLFDERISHIGKKYQKTNAQVLIRFGLELGNVVLPKSSSPARIEENFDVFDFELSEEDLETLKALNERQSVLTL